MSEVKWWRLSVWPVQLLLIFKGHKSGRLMFEKFHKENPRGPHVNRSKSSQTLKRSKLKHSLVNKVADESLLIALAV